MARKFLSKERLYEPEGIYNLHDVLNYHINRYEGKGIPREDLYQQAYLGYLTAVKNYDPTRGKMSLLYVGKYIMGSLYHYVMKENNISNLKVDLNEEIVGTTDVIVKPTSMKKHMNKINSILDLLPDEERAIIYDYYINPKNKSLLDLARERGVSKQRIHQIKAKGIETIRALLGEEYIFENSDNI